ncbi:hypothetical protein J0A71_11g24520 [Encephalitozoon cuniculi]|nr:hypothetical protein J0A71_01g00050 [Encephalitozoon cuniculi]UYI26438.1 hypothetical protein J0A71_01g02580 [Encephalitozoon cuniculi]UYI26443.1 hypothetical protein J0A71_02g02680 [Encephalitozoon cuniculi]UYI26664.1 hypothetical protein J0A71_02g04950 [Encephalitozoon cuniculi]UYI26671.1 hypothetical protein J0A71_03g05060 [Encephalitozoon cuniculi]
MNQSVIIHSSFLSSSLFLHPTSSPFSATPSPQHLLRNTFSTTPSPQHLLRNTFSATNRPNRHPYQRPYRHPNHPMPSSKFSTYHSIEESKYCYCKPIILYSSCHNREGRSTAHPKRAPYCPRQSPHPSPHLRRSYPFTICPPPSYLPSPS